MIRREPAWPLLAPARPGALQPFRAGLYGRRGERPPWTGRSTSRDNAVRRDAVRRDAVHPRRRHRGGGLRPPTGPVDPKGFRPGPAAPGRSAPRCTTDRRSSMISSSRATDSRIRSRTSGVGIRPSVLNRLSCMLNRRWIAASCTSRAAAGGQEDGVSSKSLIGAPPVGSPVHRPARDPAPVCGGRPS